jgi:hypothetical protein
LGEGLLRLAAGIAAVAAVVPACGSSEVDRRVVREGGTDSGSGGRAAGGTPGTGGKAVGGSSGSGGRFESGGAPSAGGQVQSGGSPATGGAPVDASADVSVPGDSGSGVDAAPDARFVPVVDAGTGCELAGVDPPLAPEEASLPPAGLVTWLRGDRGIYKTAAGAVCAWVDQSGAGRVFTAASPGARPLWLASGVGNQAAVDFGNEQALSVESVLVLPAQSARTLIAVQRHVTTTTRFIPITTGNLANNFTYLGIDANTFHTVGSREGVYMHGNAYDSDLATSIESRVHVYVIGPMVIGTPILPAVHYRVNGGERALTRTSGGTGNGNFESFAGAHRTLIGDTNGAAHSVLSEVLVYDHALSTADVTAVEGALKARYSIP